MEHVLISQVSRIILAKLILQGRLFLRNLLDVFINKGVGGSAGRRRINQNFAKMLMRQVMDDSLSRTTEACPCLHVYPLTSVLTFHDLSYTFLINLKPVFDSYPQLKVKARSRTWRSAAKNYNCVWPAGSGDVQGGRGCRGRLLGIGDLADRITATRAGSWAPAISLADSTLRAATIDDGDRARRRWCDAVPRGRCASRRRCWFAVSSAVVMQGRQASRLRVREADLIEFP